MQSAPFREYRIAPEFRRCCWYGIIGVAVLGGVLCWVARFVQNRPINVAIVCAPFVLLVAALTLALRWRLSVDSHGIARRRFFRWDLWTWADLASGRIRKLHPYALVDPNRPWWSRKLRFDYLAGDQVRAVVAAINTHYQLPPPPKAPESLTIKYGFRRTATLDRNGVQLLVRGTPHTYLWHEIRGVHITRMDPVRRDFKSLEIAIPDQEIELALVTTQYGTNPTWRGATSEEISEFLVRHLAPDRIDTSIVSEPLKRREDIEKKLKAARSAQRQMAIVLAVVLPLMIGVFVSMAINESVVKAIVMGVFAFSVFGPAFAYIYRSHGKQIDELEGWLNTLVDNGGWSGGDVAADRRPL
jgi:hypothetical protein